MYSSKNRNSYFMQHKISNDFLGNENLKSNTQSNLTPQAMLKTQTLQVHLYPSIGGSSD